jgi:topoisomerase-4 subunit B
VLRETTMDPKRRTLLRVVLAESESRAADELIERLMGRKPELRFAFIQENASRLEAEAIDA